MLTTLVYVLYSIGLFSSGAFLFNHRPRTFRKETVLAMGFPVAFFLFMVRGIISLISHGTVHFGSGIDAAISLTLFGLVDAVMVWLFIAFMGFRNGKKDDT